MTVSGDVFEGGCTCGEVRFRMESRPLVVHCCHCHWCQRESGASFALNALIEADRVSVLKGEPVKVLTPSNSGKGQKIWRCPNCRIALWSHYAGVGDALAFVRVGTLDEGHGISPDIHIFTGSKQPWVMIPDGHRAVERYYDLNEVWSADSLERFARLEGPADS